MKVLRYTRPNNLSQLHEELKAAIPSLAPRAGISVMSASGRGDELELGVPDGTDASAVAAVVNAHVADSNWGKPADVIRFARLKTQSGGNLANLSAAEREEAIALLFKLS